VVGWSWKLPVGWRGTDSFGIRATNHEIRLARVRTGCRCRCHEGHDYGHPPLPNHEGAGEAVMGVDKVEAAPTEGTPELEARLGVGLLALTAVKGEHLDVYAKRMHVLDQVAHEAGSATRIARGTPLPHQP
jgi:hypothetical protein